jgi:hypothetical protein
VRHEGQLPDALRAKLDEGTRRHVLRVSAEQRQWRARYAAELAVRYWREQTDMLRTKKLAKRAFKCGSAENARAWKALIDEFFARRDLAPAC